MPQREVDLGDALPAPGEPLRSKIHEKNQALLNEELAERQERARGRLKPGELRRLKGRYRKLWHKLNKAGWNQLVTDRWQAYRERETLLYDYSQSKSKKTRAKIRAQVLEINKTGRALNAKIATLQPLADEFASIARRLEIHRQIVRFEAEDRENKKAFKREAYTWLALIKAAMRQSKRMHHAGYDANGNYFCHIPIIERIFFREDRVLYLLKTTRKTLFGKWVSALPYNVDVTALTCEETIANLEAATNRTVQVVRSETGKNLFYAINRVDSPDAIPSRVLYSKVLPWYPTDQHSMTPWCAGVTENRKTQWFNFEEQPHILIAGSTLSGKSNQINAMIATMASMNSPAELLFMLVDNKGGVEFTHWAGLKHLAVPIIKRAGEVLPALELAHSVMDRRLAAFERIKAKNLASFNAKVSEESRLPRVVVIIDELATLLGLGELTTAIQNELRVISSQGRAVGIHLIICTQHTSADVVPGWIKTNMRLRIAGKMPSFHSSMTILDSASAADLPDLPGRMVFALGRYEVVAQTPLISDEEIARAVEIASQYADPDLREFAAAPASEGDTEEVPALPPILVPKPKFSLDDLAALALERFEGKLTPTRMHEVLGNEVISLRSLREMVSAVVRSGGLVYEGYQYGLTKQGHNYILVKMGAVDAANAANAGEAPENESESRSVARSDADPVAAPELPGAAEIDVAIDDLEGDELEAIEDGEFDSIAV
jgi:hypothetical protein